MAGEPPPDGSNGTSGFGSFRSEAFFQLALQGPQHVQPIAGMEHVQPTDGGVGSLAHTAAQYMQQTSSDEGSEASEDSGSRRRAREPPRQRPRQAIIPTREQEIKMGAVLAKQRKAASAMPSVAHTAGINFDRSGDRQSLVYKALFTSERCAYQHRDPLITRAQAIARALQRKQLSYDGPAPDRYFTMSGLVRERQGQLHCVHLTRGSRPLSSRKVTDCTSGADGRALPAQAGSGGGGEGGRGVTGRGTGGAGGAKAWIRMDGSVSCNQEALPVAELPQRLTQDEQPETTREAWARERTRHFNNLVHSTPSNVSAWLAYADWQETATFAHRPAKRSRAAAATDIATVAAKRVAILERGLDHNPASAQLLVALLKAAQSLLDGPALIRRWEGALTRWQQHCLPLVPPAEGLEGLALLWSEFLQLQTNMFATYTYTALQETHHRALTSLSTVLAKMRLDSLDPAQEAAAELTVARFVLSLVAEALTSGHNEEAVACVQALLEFHGFPPHTPGSIPLGAQLRMWGAFWESGAPRVGEPGAMGWAAWFRQTHEGLLLRSTAPEQAEGASAPGGAEVADEGGWAGWVAATGPLDASTQQPVSDEQDQGDEGEDAEENDEEEDEEADAALLHDLGLRLEQELAGLQKSGVSPVVLALWLEEERRRSAGRWAPQKSLTSKAELETDVEQAFDESAVVHARDVQCVLFPLKAPGVRELVLLACCALLGAPLGTGWACSNNHLLVNNRQLPVDLLQALEWQSQSCAHPLQASGRQGLPLGGVVPWGVLHPALTPEPWYTGDETRRAFLVCMLRSLTRTGGPLASHPAACRALLLVEATTLPLPPSGATASVLQQMPRARATAKAVLTEQRTDLAMWRALAAAEALAGNQKASLNMLHAALAGCANVAPMEREVHLPGLVLEAAEHMLEAPARPLEGWDQGQGQGAALHCLVWLFTGALQSAVPFQPLAPDTRVPPAAVTAARRGYTVWLPQLAARSAQGQLGQADAALLACAGLLEALAGRYFPGTAGGGMSAALAVLHNVLAGTPHSVRACSAQHEWVALQFARLALGCTGEAGGISATQARGMILEAQHLYPHNPMFVRLLVVWEAHAHAHARLRHSLAACLARQPSPELLAAQLLVDSLEAGAGQSGSGVKFSTAQEHLRAHLERGCAGELAHSEAAWMMYLRLEAHSQQWDAARRVFLRAVRSCPGSKELWLTGLSHTTPPLPLAAPKPGNQPGPGPPPPAALGPVTGRGGSGLTGREAADLLGVMRDKGLRVHTQVVEAAMAAVEAAGPSTAS